MTTVPSQAGGQRAADNQQRAAEVLSPFGSPIGLHLVRDRIAWALDEAEARGRAEVAAKVSEFAAELEEDSRTALEQADVAHARNDTEVRRIYVRHARVAKHAAAALRGLVADVVPGAQTDGETK